MKKMKKMDTLRGFTLVEAAAVLAITGIILAAAVPSYSHFVQRQQLRVAGDTLIQDLRRARDMSVNSPVSIFFTFQAGPRWCWGVSRGLPCDCAGNVTPTSQPLARCDIAQGDNREQFKDVLLDAAQDFVFAPGLGQVARSGAAALRTKKGQNLQVVLNPLGRAHLCGRDAPGSQPC
ncbi:hypothetical protein BH11PSE10_BH11PSE10_05570 [soil metagenome]